MQDDKLLWQQTADKLQNAFDKNFHSRAPFIPDAAEVTAIFDGFKDLLFQYSLVRCKTCGQALLADCAARLEKQILNALCFTCQTPNDCAACNLKAADLTRQFVAALADIQHLVLTDVQAAYEGDPAARHMAEPLLCYPGVLAVTLQRMAHFLYKQGVELIPRIITEHAHSLTGIDIHPGAQIGPAFFIDHGTGVVIGETCVIGQNVKLYQGVTLGAKSFPLDANGNPVKGIKRHPNIGDNVIIYAETTILGNITIGENSVIGANQWVTKDVPPNTKVS